MRFFFSWVMVNICQLRGGWVGGGGGGEGEDGMVAE